MKVISQDQHHIDRDSISVNALKVINRLQSKGFQAYLVGGAVRDLLLGGHPKDFDIATSATPEQVHAQFRNSRIIGRRFQIVHVRFGREILEVTTFRGHHGGESGDDVSAAGGARRAASGLLLRDNVFGTLAEDAVRRDLTVNAFYYDPAEGTIFDHVEGMSDLRSGTIRVIGEADTRFTEDPVRMLRVLRFAAKLGFSLQAETAAAIPRNAGLLAAIPPARLFDEFLKLFMSGYGAAALEQLLAHELLQYLFPQTVEAVARDDSALRLIQFATANTDRRIAENKPVTPAFILGALLWPSVMHIARDRQASEGEAPIPALHTASQEVLRDAVRHIAIPRRFSLPMRDIWELQIRLEQRRGRKAAELVDKRRFRAAYDFLLLREEAGEDTGGLGQWWTTFQELPFEERLAMASRPGKGGKKQTRKKRLRTAS